MTRALLFGGSFDPIHHGHLIVARFVAEQLGVVRVVLIPGAAPPHKLDRQLTVGAERLAACRLAVADEPLFEVCDWELTQPGPNYTLNTVNHFRAALGPGVELCWLLGMDSLLELHTWYRATELVELCTFVTAVRPGCVPPDAAQLARHFSPAQAARLVTHIVASPCLDIASTEIRARVRAGRSIRYLVPGPVRKFIDERGLYRA